MSMDPAIRLSLFRRAIDEAKDDPNHALGQVLDNPERESLGYLGVLLDQILDYTFDGHQPEIDLLEKIEKRWSRALSSLASMQSLKNELDALVPQLSASLSPDGGFDVCALKDVVARLDLSSSSNLKRFADLLEDVRTDLEDPSWLLSFAPTSSLADGVDSKGLRLGDLARWQRTGRFRLRLAELASASGAVDLEAVSFGASCHFHASLGLMPWNNIVCGAPPRLRPMSHVVLGRAIGRAVTPGYSVPRTILSALDLHLDPTSLSPVWQTVAAAITDTYDCHPALQSPDLKGALSTAYDRFRAHLDLMASLELPDVSGLPDWGSGPFADFLVDLPPPSGGAPGSGYYQGGSGCGTSFDFSDFHEKYAKGLLDSGITDLRASLVHLNETMAILVALYDQDWEEALRLVLKASLIVALTALLPAASPLLIAALADLGATVAAEAAFNGGDVDGADLLDSIKRSLGGELEASLKAELDSLGIDVSIDNPFDSLTVDELPDFGSFPNLPVGSGCELPAVSIAGIDYVRVVQNYFEAQRTATDAALVAMSTLLRGLKLVGLVYPDTYDLSNQPYSDVVAPGPDRVAVLQSATYPATCWHTKVSSGGAVVTSLHVIPWGGQDSSVGFAMEEPAIQMNALPTLDRSLSNAVRRSVLGTSQGAASSPLIRGNYNLDVDRDQRMACWKIKSGTTVPSFGSTTTGYVIHPVELGPFDPIC